MAIEKVTREQFATYLNTTPKTESETWSILGVGITNYGIAFNPQVETEKWIINKNATSGLNSNQKQGEASQKIYKGDPCFEYVYSLMDKVGSEVETQILDIDMWNGTEGTFKAKKSNCIIAITNYMGEDASIEYSIYYNGDPIKGTVTLDTKGKPTFAENGSL